MLRRHPFLSFATFAYLGVVAWVTLGPQPLDDSANSLLWRALAFFGRHESTDWITYNRVEFAANVAMFIPIGLFFLLLFGRRQWWLAIIFSIGLTVAIESTQLLLPGRVTDIRDIVSNSTGGVIGVIGGLLLTWPKAHRLKKEAQRRQAQQRPRVTDDTEPLLIR